MNEVPCPNAPPFPVGDSGAIVDKEAAPRGIQLGNRRGQGNAEEYPGQPFDREDLPDKRTHGEQEWDQAGMD
jgi:hypothetical protein